MPRAIYSAPDGSCLLVVQDEDGKRTITAHHWATFASAPGISVPCPDFLVDLDAALLTSIVNRNNVHLIGLSLETQTCRSVVLDITGKATEFTFQERRSKGSSRYGKQTVHNCLIDCHRDLWTRFPVVAAVKRQTVTSSSQRRQKTLVYVTDDHGRPFSSHFSDMISAFEKSSRKPTNEELKSIMVQHGLSPLGHNSTYLIQTGRSRASEPASGLPTCYVSSLSISRSLNRTDSFRSRTASYHLSWRNHYLGQK
jgi:hypothetical protein